MSVLEIKEKDLHPYLVYFAHQQFGCYSKTIEQSKSSNTHAGENEWVHPDIVSFKLMRNDFNPQVKTFYRHMNQDIAYLYSFELKKEVRLSDLKKYYFQAVSNSSWANEGYLVTASLDISNKVLMNEIERLTQAFGIGVILLNLEDVDQSYVLFEAKKKVDLDFYTINKLVEQENSDFIEFIKVITSCLETNDPTNESAIIQTRMDQIEDFKSKNSKDNPKKVCEELDDNPLQINDDLNWYPLKGRDFTDTKAVAIKIKDQIIPIKNWRYALVEVAKYCKTLNPALFKRYCFYLESEGSFLFFRESQRYWKDKRSQFHPIDANTYIYTHGANNEICKLMKKIAETFDIPFDEILVQIEEKKDSK